MVARRPPELTARPLVIGWREPVLLPDWGILRIKTKIDTGARTSALHVSHITPLENGRVRFCAVVSLRRVEGRRRVRRVPIETDVIRRTRVRLSSGWEQDRLVVRTLALLGSVEREIELTLVCRRHMLCRLLVGRSALDGILVDPARTAVHGRLIRPGGTGT